ncbi:MAG TPA: glycosyltransferase family 4 protein [Chitinophagaceae bacterium]|nr:glycosyltransferase family 4 protein [Chitinophagaceae bacterium]
MRILFIHNRYKRYGGEDMAVESETSVLADKGHEVKTIFFDNNPIRGFGARVKAAFSSIYNFSSVRKVAGTIKEFDPDIIHIHNMFFIASPSVIYVASRYKVPVVMTLHNYRLICANALLLRDSKPCELCVNKKFPTSGIRYKCYRDSAIESGLVTTITGLHKVIGTWKNKVTAYITLNEFSRSKFLYSSLRLPPEKIITKPNFVADPGDGHEQREEFFLFAGRITREKGAHILTRAFANMPDQKIKIVGDGPEKKLLEQEFKHYPNISFMGHLDTQQVKDYMKRCRAFICPSIWYEGTPLTVIEAFASGTPVIASRLGVLCESITDGHNGFHFTAGDAVDLEKKIEIFLRETANGKMLYNNARQTYLEKYHPEIHYRAILKIYENAIANYD